MPQIDNYTRCYQSAMGMLARREHSRLELINKLSSKPFSEDVDLHILCDFLEESNYLSNQRFAEMFVRSRVNRGQGEMKIRFELGQRGVEEFLSDQAIAEAEVAWLELARQQREKKYGCEIPKDYKEKARQSRFLMGRGFSGEIISKVFRRVGD